MATTVALNESSPSPTTSNPPSDGSPDSTSKKVTREPTITEFISGDPSPWQQQRHRSPSIQSVTKSPPISARGGQLANAPLLPLTRSGSGCPPVMLTPLQSTPSRGHGTPPVPSPAAAGSRSLVSLSTTEQSSSQPLSDSPSTPPPAAHHSNKPPGVLRPSSRPLASNPRIPSPSFNSPGGPDVFSTASPIHPLQPSPKLSPQVRGSQSRSSLGEDCLLPHPIVGKLSSPRAPNSAGGGPTTFIAPPSSAFSSPGSPNPMLSVGVPAVGVAAAPTPSPRRCLPALPHHVSPALEDSTTSSSSSSTGPPSGSTPNSIAGGAGGLALPRPPLPIPSPSKASHPGSLGTPGGSRPLWNPVGATDILSLGPATRPSGKPLVRESDFTPSPSNINASSSTSTPTAKSSSSAAAHTSPASQSHFAASLGEPAIPSASSLPISPNKASSTSSSAPFRSIKQPNHTTSNASVSPEGDPATSPQSQGEEMSLSVGSLLDVPSPKKVRSFDDLAAEDDYQGSTEIDGDGNNASTDMPIGETLSAPKCLPPRGPADMGVGKKGGGGGGPTFHRRRPQLLSEAVLMDSHKNEPAHDDPAVAQEIIPNLYLGPQTFARNIDKLQHNRITHILIVSRGLKPVFPDAFTYHVIEDLEDDPHQEILRPMTSCFDFIDKARADPHRLLVHCNAGVSRSPTVVIGYMMRTFGYGFVQAYDLVQQKRSVACPNTGFIKQLQRFERMNRTLEGDTEAHLLHALLYPRMVPIDSILAKWSHLRSVTLSEDPDFTNNISTSILRLPNLTALDVSFTHVTDEGFQNVYMASSLTSLHLRGAPCTDTTILSLSPKCPLRALSTPKGVGNASAIFVARTFGNTLTELEFANSSMDVSGLQEILARCSVLKTLTLANVSGLPTNVASLIPSQISFITSANYPHAKRALPERVFEFPPPTPAASACTPGSHPLPVPS